MPVLSSTTSSQVIQEVEKSACKCANNQCTCTTNSRCICTTVQTSVYAPPITSVFESLCNQCICSTVQTSVSAAHTQPTFRGRVVLWSHGQLVTSQIGSELSSNQKFASIKSASEPDWLRAPSKLQPKFAPSSIKSASQLKDFGFFCLGSKYSLATWWGRR